MNQTSNAWSVADQRLESVAKGTSGVLSRSNVWTNDPSIFSSADVNLSKNMIKQIQKSQPDFKSQMLNTFYCYQDTAKGKLNQIDLSVEGSAFKVS